MSNQKINASEEIILEELLNGKEFSKFRSKLEDRKYLTLLNKDQKIKYTIKGSIDTYSKKCFLLLQAALSNINIDQWEIRREQNEILKYTTKILNCIKALFKETDNAIGYEKTLFLMKSINQRIWNDSDLIPIQLPKIGEKLARQFIKVGLNSFDKIKNENPRKLESICGKNAPFGNIIIDYIRSFPSINVKYELLKNYKNYYKLQVTIKAQYIKYLNNEDFDPYSLFHLVISRSNNSILLRAKLKPYDKICKLG